MHHSSIYLLCCFLQEFPSSVCSLDNIEVLEASGNGTLLIPSYFSQLTALVHIDLHGNKLDTFPPEFCSLDKLERLNLSNNCITSVPERVKNMNALQVLDLSHNKFEEFPREVCQIANLAEFTFNQEHGSRIVQLVPELELSSIITLNVCHNDLTAIPDELMSMRQLASLDLSHNKLKTLPKQLCGMKNLRVLNLSYNLLERLPENFDSLTGLTELQLHGNPLKNPPTDVVIGGVLQPISCFLRKAIEREGMVLATVKKCFYFFISVTWVSTNSGHHTEYCL